MLYAFSIKSVSNDIYEGSIIVHQTGVLQHDTKGMYTMPLRLQRVKPGGAFPLETVS